MRAFALLFASFVTLAGTSTVAVAGDPPLTISGPSKVKAYEMVRLQASGGNPKAGLLWRVSPSKDVSRATPARKGLLEFVAPPGKYTVELISVMLSATGETEIAEVAHNVEIEGSPMGPPPVVPPKPEGKGGKLDPAKALGKISFPPYGCTATVIGPRRQDGRWDVLSAAHCVDHVKVGSKGTMKMLDGRVFAITVVVQDGDADVSWLVVDDPGVDDMPYAILAAKNPPIGTKIWHAGYGVDKPGNLEEGEVTGGQLPNGQLPMYISVSSGDSGGGLFRSDNNEVISTVCCTARKGARASVYGCSAEVATARRPKTAQMFEFTPPAEPKPEAFEWTPRSIPTLSTFP